MWLILMVPILAERISFFGGVAGTLNASAADVIIDGRSAHDLFGFSVSPVEDLNGDDKSEVIVGAIGISHMRGDDHIT